MAEGIDVSLDKLFRPERVAVFCDSAQRHDQGEVVARNLIDGGFAGELVLVDPQRDELLGRPCLRDPRDHPRRVDLALVAAAPADLKRSVDRSIMAGARAVVVLTELEEPEHAGLVEEIRNLCASRSVQLVGPGSPGVVNLHARLNASCAESLPGPGGVALVSESRAVALALIDQAAAADLGLSKVVGLGDKAGLDEVALFRALAEDEQTRVVIAYLETIEHGKEFLTRAEALAGSKPVIVLKAGITHSGELAAEAHTGHAARSNLAYGAAFKRAGVLRAASFQQVFDLASALSCQPLPAGDRVAVVSNAGGPGILSADAVDDAGLRLAVLDLSHSAGLQDVGARNPIELPSVADGERLGVVLRGALASDAVDAGLLLITPAVICEPIEVVEAASRVAVADKPLLAVVLGGNRARAMRLRLTASGVPAYASPERAVAALAEMTNYAAWRRRPPRVITRFRVNRQRVERILLRHERQQLNQVQEHLARDLLEAYDFRVPAGHLVATADDAVEAAERLGFPVSLEVVSSDVADKTALGGIRRELTGPAAVRDAYDLVMLHIGRQAPEATVEGVLVSAQVPAGMAVVIGMQRDPQFGPMLMFGLGGVMVEVMQDVAFHLAPVTAEEAKQMLRATRSYRLLEARRLQTGADLDAIVTGLQRISQLATDFPRIAELEINPFVVYRPGAAPVAAGTRIMLSAGSAP